MSTAVRSRPSRRSLVVDCHAHALPPSVLSAFHRWVTATGATEDGPQHLWSAQSFGSPMLQVESLDRTGMDNAVLMHSSSTPAALHAGAVAERLRPADMIRRVNEELRGWATPSGGRLLATSFVDPRFVDSSLEEIDRVARAPGGRAISVLTAYKDADGGLRLLDHPDFDPILALAAELGVPLFVHTSTKLDFGGAGVPPLPGLAGKYLIGGLSMLIENTLCLLRLVLGGTLDRHPDLRLIVGQLGGVFPFVFGRFDLIDLMLSEASAKVGDDSAASGRSKGLLRNLRDYTDQIYVDTHSMDGPAIECALEVLGPRRVVFGSDYPVTPERLGRQDGLALIRSLGLDPDDRDAILGNTAADLFGIPKEVVR